MLLISCVRVTVKQLLIRGLWMSLEGFKWVTASTGPPQIPIHHPEFAGQGRKSQNVSSHSSTSRSQFGKSWQASITSTRGPAWAPQIKLVLLKKLEASPYTETSAPIALTPLVLALKQWLVKRTRGRYQDCGALKGLNCSKTC